MFGLFSAWGAVWEQRRGLGMRDHGSFGELRAAALGGKSGTAVSGREGQSREGEGESIA